eukprot:3924512-Pyramimonas_sp.AAC.1
MNPDWNPERALPASLTLSVRPVTEDDSDSAACATSAPRCVQLSRRQPHDVSNSAATPAHLSRQPRLHARLGILLQGSRVVLRKHFRVKGCLEKTLRVSRVVLRKHFDLAIPLQVLRGLVVLGPAAQKTPTRLRERGRQGWGRTVGRGAYLGGRLGEGLHTLRHRRRGGRGLE